MRYTYRHRVRYRECDPMGVVYHSHALDWFEAARTEALRDAGLAYKDLEATGVILPVVEAVVRYHAPARYDDVLEIEARFPDEAATRLPIEYAVRREGEARDLVTGRVTLCFVDAERGRPTSPPPVIVEIFDRLAHESSQ